MNIKIKYDNGDTVWYILNSKIKSVSLFGGFKINCTYKGYSGVWGSEAFPIVIKYLVEKPTGNPTQDIWLDEGALFVSKEELLKSL